MDGSKLSILLSWIKGHKIITIISGVILSSGITIGGLAIGGVFTNKKANEEYHDDYLCFEAVGEDNPNEHQERIITCTRGKGFYYLAFIQYSFDQINWITINNGDYVDKQYKFHLANNQKVYFRNISCNQLSTGSDIPYHFDINNGGITGVGVNISGNINSLIHYSDPSPLSFASLFANNNNIFDASELILPSTHLAKHCYDSLFWNCSNLIKAPAELPSLTLANACYASMFSNCVSLTNVPIVKGDTYNYYPGAIHVPDGFTNGCYFDMFSGCTSLNIDTIPGTDGIIFFTASNDMLNPDINMFAPGMLPSSTPNTNNGTPIAGTTYCYHLS